MTLDIEDVATRLNLVLRRAMGGDLPTASADSVAGARAVARYAAMIADAYAAGSLEDEEMRRELREIARMTRIHAGAIHGVAGAVAEQARRAAVDVVLGALRASLGFAGAPLPQGMAESAA